MKLVIVLLVALTTVGLCIGYSTITRDKITLPIPPINTQSNTMIQPDVNPYFAIENSSADIVFKVDHEGHVGINTPSPHNNLQVMGDGNFTTNVTISSWTIGQDGTSLTFWNGGVIKMTLDVNGKLHVKDIVIEEQAPNYAIIS